MRHFHTHIIFLLVAALVLCLATVALASPRETLNQGLQVTGAAGNLTAETGAAAEATDLPTLLGRTVNVLFGVLGAIFLTVVLIGGYMWMTAGGSEEKVMKAKGFIINGINGMIVIFLAYALTYVILYALGYAIMGTPPK